MYVKVNNSIKCLFVSIFNTTTTLEAYLFNLLFCLLYLFSNTSFFFICFKFILFFPCLLLILLSYVFISVCVCVTSIPFPWSNELQHGLRAYIDFHFSAVLLYLLLRHRPLAYRPVVFWAIRPNNNNTNQKKSQEASMQSNPSRVCVCVCCWAKNFCCTCCFLLARLP